MTIDSLIKIITNYSKQARHFIDLILKVNAVYEWRSRLTYVRSIISKHESNPLINNKVIAQISWTQTKFNNLRPFKGQGQIRFKRIECVVRNVIMYDVWRQSIKIINWYPII